VRLTLSDDVLDADNEVVLVEPRSRTVGVENRLPEGRGHEAVARALDALSGVTRTETGHLAFIAAADLDAPARPGTWRAAFGRAPAAGPAESESADYIGPFVMEKRHPLLQGVTLAGILWAGAVPLSPATMRPIVSAGDRGLVGVVASRASGGDITLLFNLDFERTNLVRSPDWPILISNLVEMRRLQLPGPERWNYRAGEWIRVRLDRQPSAPLRLRTADGERDLQTGRLLEFVAPAAGGLVHLLEGDQVLYELAVNALDEAESDLRDRSSGEHGSFDALPSGLDAESGTAFDPLFWVLLAVAAAAMLGNWCLPGVRQVTS
jgi:Ca-activated chloride channel homolog